MNSRSLPIPILRSGGTPAGSVVERLEDPRHRSPVEATPPIPATALSFEPAPRGTRDSHNSPARGPGLGVLPAADGVASRLSKADQHRCGCVSNRPVGAPDPARVLLSHRSTAGPRRGSAGLEASRKLDLTRHPMPEGEGGQAWRFRTSRDTRRCRAWSPRRAPARHGRPFANGNLPLDFQSRPLPRGRQ